MNPQVSGNGTIDDRDAEDCIAGDEGRFDFQIGSRRISKPFLAGRFPDWLSITPTEVNHQITILAAAGRRLLWQALTITTSDDSRIRVDFNEVQTTVTVSTADVGSMRAEASATLTDAPCFVRYDRKYLLDLFQRCDDGAMVRREFKDRGSATVVSLMSDEWQYLVMPIGDE